jgi:hypothetical protein
VMKSRRLTGCPWRGSKFIVTSSARVVSRAIQQKAGAHVHFGSLAAEPSRPRSRPRSRPMSAMPHERKLKIRVLMSPRPRQAGGANDNLQMCLCRRDWRNVNCIFFFIGHSGLAVCRDLKRQPVGALCPSQDACIAARPNVFHCFYQSSGLSL